MTTLTNPNPDAEHESMLVELEYMISEMLASSEFSLVAMILAVWIFLRVYWFGLNLISYFASGQKID